MHPDVLALMEKGGGLATTAQLLTLMTRQQLDVQVKKRHLVRVWYGVYATARPDLLGRLAALDLFMGSEVVCCMGTAAALHGFDIQSTSAIHVLDPGVRMRPAAGLMVHQRVGARLKRVSGRLSTAPAWTAVEIARTLRRPRALAVLDAALHCGACTHDELSAAIDEQKGRRGIVKVRELAVHADARAESAMESEARLVFIDGGLPLPELQYEIIDRCGELWRVDFAWPEARLAVEYDSVEWHANPTAFKHDRIKTSRLQECGWSVMPIVVDDVRKNPLDLVARIFGHLERASSLAG